MKVLSRKWWTEKVVEVPEHYMDWYAPRWYAAAVSIVWLSLITGLIYTVIEKL